MNISYPAKVDNWTLVKLPKNYSSSNAELNFLSFKLIKFEINVHCFYAEQSFPRWFLATPHIWKPLDYLHIVNSTIYSTIILEQRNITICYNQTINSYAYQLYFNCTFEQFKSSCFVLIVIEIVLITYWWETQTAYNERVAYREHVWCNLDSMSAENYL